MQLYYITEERSCEPLDVLRGVWSPLRCPGRGIVAFQNVSRGVGWPLKKAPKRGRVAPNMPQDGYGGLFYVTGGDGGPFNVTGGAWWPFKCHRRGMVAF